MRENVDVFHDFGGVKIDPLYDNDVPVVEDDEADMPYMDEDVTFHNDKVRT